MIRANAVLMFPKGAGCGNELAKWIVHGRPELDMYGYDIRRFCPGNSFDFADLFVHGGVGGTNPTKLFYCIFKCHTISNFIRFKNRPFPDLFFFIFTFSIQLTVK